MMLMINGVFSHLVNSARCLTTLSHFKRCLVIVLGTLRTPWFTDLFPLLRDFFMSRPRNGGTVFLRTYLMAQNFPSTLFSYLLTN